MCVHVCAHVYKYPWMPEGSGSSEARAIGGCESPDKGAGEWTLVSCKSKKHSLLVHWVISPALHCLFTTKGVGNPGWPIPSQPQRRLWSPSEEEIQNLSSITFFLVQAVALSAQISGEPLFPYLIPLCTLLTSHLGPSGCLSAIKRYKRSRPGNYNDFPSQLLRQANREREGSNSRQMTHLEYQMYLDLSRGLDALKLDKNLGNIFHKYLKINALWDKLGLIEDGRKQLAADKTNSNLLLPIFDGYKPKWFHIAFPRLSNVTEQPSVFPIKLWPPGVLFYSFSICHPFTLITASLRCHLQIKLLPSTFCLSPLYPWKSKSKLISSNLQSLSHLVCSQWVVPLFHCPSFYIISFPSLMENFSQSPSV